MLFVNGGNLSDRKHNRMPPGAQQEVTEPTSDISPKTGGAKPNYRTQAGMTSKGGQYNKLLKEVK